MSQVKPNDTPPGLRIHTSPNPISGRLDYTYGDMSTDSGGATYFVSELI